MTSWWNVVFLSVCALLGYQDFVNPCDKQYIKPHFTGNYDILNHCKNVFLSTYWYDYGVFSAQSSTKEALWVCDNCQKSFPCAVRNLRLSGKEKNLQSCPLVYEVAATKSIIMMMLYFIMQKDLTMTSTQRPRVDIELEIITSILQKIDCCIRAETVDKEEVIDVVLDALIEVYRMSMFLGKIKNIDEGVSFLLPQAKEDFHPRLAPDESLYMSLFLRNCGYSIPGERFFYTLNTSINETIANILSATSKAIFLLYNVIGTWNGFPEMIFQNKLGFVDQPQGYFACSLPNSLTRNIEAFIDCKKRVIDTSWDVVTFLRFMHAAMTDYHFLDCQRRYERLRGIHQFFTESLLMLYHLTCKPHSNNYTT